MTFTYCDARHDGTPVHRCLCRHRHGHTGPHGCVCGHDWGIDWNHLTYDQQRELLGLPELAPAKYVVYNWLPGDQPRQPWVIWHWNDECTPLKCVCSVSALERP